MVARIARFNEETPSLKQALLAKIGLSNKPAAAPLKREMAMTQETLSSYENYLEALLKEERLRTQLAEAIRERQVAQECYETDLARNKEYVW